MGYSRPPSGGPEATDSDSNAAAARRPTTATRAQRRLQGHRQRAVPGGDLKVTESEDRPRASRGPPTARAMLQRRNHAESREAEVVRSGAPDPLLAHHFPRRLLAFLRQPPASNNQDPPPPQPTHREPSEHKRPRISHTIEPVPGLPPDRDFNHLSCTDLRSGQACRTRVPHSEAASDSTNAGAKTLPHRHPYLPRRHPRHRQTGNCLRKE